METAGTFQQEKKGVHSQTSLPHVWLGVSRHINDNYCVKCSTLQAADPGQRNCNVCKVVSAPLDRTGPQEPPRDCKLVSVSTDRISVQRDSKLLSVSNNYKLSCCKSCTYCSRAATKERRKSSYGTKSVIKICEQCFLCRLIVFCQTCTKCCIKSACRGQTRPVLGNLGSLGGRTQSSTNVERGLQPTLTGSPTIISLYVHPHRNLYLLEAWHQLTNKNAVELVKNQ